MCAVRSGLYASAGATRMRYRGDVQARYRCGLSTAGILHGKTLWSAVYVLSAEHAWLCAEPRAAGLCFRWSMPVRSGDMRSAMCGKGLWSAVSILRSAGAGMYGLTRTVLL